ncbi:MAG TPA: diacylglycerol kinase family protein, partial [Rudaea sp.]|nr:diacylglycerol kinase family protein [Rudaea sp.]
IVNSHAGSVQHPELRDRISAICAESGAEARIITSDAGQAVPLLARQALDSADVVVAVGGDGTINAVASVLAGSGVPLGVLPFGTLNHFAKDARIPLDLDSAVRNAIAGTAAHIDVGEVNGRIFLNNSSLGLYPRMVEQRTEEQQRGASKWPAFARAMLSVLWRYPPLRAQIVADQTTLSRKTPFIFIGNNHYDVEGRRVGSRHRLDAGELSLITARPVSRSALVWSAVRTLFQGPQPGSAFDYLTAHEIVVRVRRRRRVLVALDGEVMQLEPLLHYRIRPGALRVMLPAAAESAA